MRLASPRGHLDQVRAIVTDISDLLANDHVVLGVYRRRLTL